MSQKFILILIRPMGEITDLKLHYTISDFVVEMLIK